MRYCVTKLVENGPSYNLFFPRGFIHQRQILIGVLVANELIGLIMLSDKGVIFNIDLEKCK